MDYPKVVCHASIGNPRVSNPKCIATEIAVRRRRERYLDEPSGLTDSYVNFLRTDRLWAPYIVNVGEDFITIDSSAPQNVLQALMMASRCVWEASMESFELFNDALSRGLPSRVAFIYAFHTNASTREHTMYGAEYNKAKIVGGTIILPKCNHRPWGLLPLKGIKKYLESDFAPTKEYATYHTTRGVQSMFGEVRDEYVTGPWLMIDLFNDKRFTEALSEFRKSRVKEEGVAIFNPFAPKVAGATPPANGEVTFTEYRNVVLDYLVNEFCLKEEIRNVA